MATTAFRTGPLVVGVTANDDHAMAVLRAVLAEHLADGEDAPLNYSVRIEPPPPDGRGRRDLHTLYRGKCLALRTRHAPRVVAAVAQCLEHHGRTEPGAPVRTAHVAVVGPAGAVLVPPDLLPRVEAGAGALAAHGIGVPVAPYGELDPATGELVVPDTAWPSAPLGAEHELPAGTVVPGRYPLRSWWLTGSGAHQPGRREALAVLAPALAADLDRADVAVVEAVAHALARTSVEVVGPGADARELLTRLLAG